MALSGVLSAATTSANHSSSVRTPIPGLRLTLPASEEPAAAVVILNVPLFYVSDTRSDQDQGVVFSLLHEEIVVAHGGYSFPYEAHGKGRLPITLTAAVPLKQTPTEVVAVWETYGRGLRANIDSFSTLIATLAPMLSEGRIREADAGNTALKRDSSRRAAERPPQASEIWIPFRPGSSVQVRFRGPARGP